jgi:hypothetical protein
MSGGDAFVRSWVFVPRRFEHRGETR